MPNKHNEDRRHHIAKKSMRVTNWAEYNAGLRWRGSLTLWITEEAVAAWRAPARLTRGGQAHYSDSAIKTNLLLRSAFRMPLRQAQGLMTSVFELLDVDLPARRTCYGAMAHRHQHQLSGNAVAGATAAMEILMNENIPKKPTDTLLARSRREAKRATTETVTHTAALGGLCRNRARR